MLQLSSLSYPVVSQIINHDIITLLFAHGEFWAHIKMTRDISKSFVKTKQFMLHEQSVSWHSHFTCLQSQSFNTFLKFETIKQTSSITIHSYISNSPFQFFKIQKRSCPSQDCAAWALARGSHSTIAYRGYRLTTGCPRQPRGSKENTYTVPLCSLSPTPQTATLGRGVPGKVGNTTP